MPTDARATDCARLYREANSSGVELMNDDVECIPVKVSYIPFFHPV